MKFQHIMNSAACLITGSRKIEHITRILVGLHWLPIEHVVNFKLLCLTYKALHRLALAYIIVLLKSNSPTRSLHSADQDLLCIPYALTKKYGMWAFAYAASKLYNDVLLNIRKFPTLNIFKNSLRIYLP